MKSPFARRLYAVWIRNFSDTDSFDRTAVRLIISFTIIGTMVSLSYFLAYPYVPFNVPRYLFVLLPAMSNACCLLLLTRTPVQVIANGLIASFWICFVIGAYHSGGVHSLVLPWLTLMPVMANLLVNYRLSKIWFGVSFVSVMAFAFFHTQLPGVEHPDETPLYIASVTGLCLILFLFTSLFDRARYKILRLLKIRNEDLVMKQKEITEVNLKLKDKVDEIDQKNRRLEEHWNTLIDISKHKHINFGTLEEALNHTAQVTAKSLDVGRASVWLYHDASEVSERIECVSAYDLQQDRYFKNEELTREANPRYFQALKMERVVVADDAQQHPDTEAFTKTYLAVHDIRSMLDAPFFMDGKLAGVICCENQGDIKSWKPEDIIFATSMAEIVSLAFRSAARRAYEKQLRILSKEVKQQNELLTRKSQEVIEANESLERRVQARTEELVEKNRQLAEYAFINSHMLRAPLCRILGLVNLFNYSPAVAEDELIERLKVSSEELDQVINKISKAIADETFNSPKV